MDNQNSAAALSGQTMEMISAYSKNKLSPDEVFTFDVTLCDNDVDRDGDRFTTECLYDLAPLMKGRTGICDHDARAENQLARLYDCKVVKCSEQNSLGESLYKLVGSAYMMRLDSTADLIRQIEGGIKKEVSISCAVSKQTCCVCGKDIRICGHIKGRTYRGKKCYASLSEPTDGYEWSFVAVPAQKNAGVSKAFVSDNAPADDFDVKKAFATGDFGLCPDTVRVNREDIEELAKTALRIRELAKAGEKYLSITKDGILRMMKLLDGGVGEKTAESIVQKLSQSELEELKASLEARCAKLYPLRPQTAVSKSPEAAPSMDGYKI